MILTCPECSTSYFVDDARIPAAGRSVKCTSCGHRWTAHRETEPTVEEAPAPVQSDETSDLVIEAPAAEAAAPEDDIAFTPRPNAAREAARARKRQEAAKEGRGKAVVLAAAAALVIAVVAGALVFRGQVVRLWPQSGAAYASLGLPVNAAGLVIEDVRAEPTFQGGRPALSVTGAIRNLRDTPMTTPAIRISLIGRTGKPLSAKILHPTDPKVPAGASRHFAVAIVDPPAGAHDLEISFDDKPGVRAAAAPVPPPAAAPPAPVDAKPLPAGAPDAIAQHG
jgi:predicted Zn finger-like uncharacterized protein